MTRPRLLDLFCGAGGAGAGYAAAGFDVVGFDINPQPNYPFEFVQRDAMGVLQELADGSYWNDVPFAVHASPPCQRWLGVPFALGASEYPDLLTPTRELLVRSGLPYVIENVPGAPLDGFILCGQTFGLPTARHRRFEVNPPILMAPSNCPQSKWARGSNHPGTYPFAHGAWRPAWRKFVLPVIWPWMTLEESHEAIPPVYTQWIGEQLIASLERAA